MIAIQFKIQKSTKINVYNHLLSIDKDFNPKLSDILDLEVFSNKITNSTIRFEAWDVEKLIGLVSAYYNDYEKKFGFINHIGVLKEYRNRGIADILLTNSFQYGIDKGFKNLRLEVSQDNELAMKLYKKHNFHIKKRQSNIILMCKNLKIGEIK